MLEQCNDPISVVLFYKTLSVIVSITDVKNVRLTAEAKTFRSFAISSLFSVLWGVAVCCQVHYFCENLNGWMCMSQLV